MSPGLGARVIRRDANGRARDALGTVIDLDPYVDRAVVEVLHEDGSRRWHPSASLRSLGVWTSEDVLAADLIDALGAGAPGWTGSFRQISR